MEENHLSGPRMSVRAIPWPPQHLCIHRLRDNPILRKGWQRLLLLPVPCRADNAAGTDPMALPGVNGQDHPSRTFGNPDSAEGRAMPPLPGQRRGKVCP